MTPPRRGTPDFLLLFLTLALVAFGFLMVFSASSVSATYYWDDPWHYTKRQSVSILIGLFLMFFFMNVNPAKLKRWVMPLFTLVFLSLLFVLVIAAEKNGARSWIEIGPLNLQPSEFAKIAVIMYLALIISKKEERFRDFKKGLMPALVIVGLVCGLILMQNDLGSTAVLAGGAAVVIIVGGANLKHIFALAAGFLTVAALSVSVYLLRNPGLMDGTTSDYRLNRITSFLDPWHSRLDSGYHLTQSLMAFGHGGLTGTGFGKSIQKMHFLPAPHNDFIFSVIGEEFGFLGSTLFLLVFLLFIWRGIVVSIRCTDTFARLCGIGFFGLFGIQAFINIGGVTGAIPLTGVTLPLISYGGSSLMAIMMGIGIVLGFSREQNKPETADQPARNKTKRDDTKVKRRSASM
ncbi:putative lipid II flippase FtsW [Paenibacillus contaminans]|uniref:Probable peptidoglycan glycosyltransferase FtsW n=1 Tax=Paenibacillus contaminans TaxID=450362 RepID=A0A329MJC6_9BACL|nr:putative lipid II flippase FtsW [Paenibacillus contaminans]RAV19925.1 putative lipid II flippase FtsW [Paenibacillus contaminans]